jgi:hypothetical protein
MYTAEGDLTVLQTTLSLICPAQEQICFKCRRLNQFSEQCKFESVHELHYEDDTVDCVCELDGENDQEVFVHTVKSFFHLLLIKFFVNVLIGTQDKFTNINCKIDTGSQINCLPNHMSRELKMKHALETSKRKINFVHS